MTGTVNTTFPVGIQCPICGNDVDLITSTKVTCDCCAEISVRPTCADPGIVVEVKTDSVNPQKALHQCLIGAELFMVALDANTDRSWLVKEKTGVPVSIELFINTPTHGKNVHTMKLQ